MRILHIVLNTTGKGTYWRALHFARYQTRLGHDVTLVATSPTAKVGISLSEVDGVNVVEMPDLYSGSLRSGWDLWNSLNRVTWLAFQPRFDVIHAYECRPTVLLPMLLGKYLQHSKLVIDWADWFGKGGSVEERPNPIVRAILRPVETFFEERFRHHADATTVICSLLREKAVRLGIASDSILLLPNGAETERFQPIELNQARRLTGLDENVLYLGYLGNIFQQDAELLAAAFEHILLRFPQTKLLMIGYGALDMRQLVSNPQAVIQTGRLDEVSLNAYLSACDVLCLPLRNSNANQGRFPMKLSDYMAVGRPIVATAVGDVTMLFHEEAIGRLAEDATESFSQAVEALLANAELREQLGKQARVIAEQRFSWERLSEQLMHCYQTIGARR